MIFKTIPNSTVNVDLTSYVIDGVFAKVVDMPLTLTDGIEFTIYLEFYKNDTEGNLTRIPRSEMNADRSDFFLGVKAAYPEGTPDGVIDGVVDQIMRAMVAGTASQKWDAYNAVLGGYGATLLPLAEQ